MSLTKSQMLETLSAMTDCDKKTCAANPRRPRRDHQGGVVDDRGGHHPRRRQAQGEGDPRTQNAHGCKPFYQRTDALQVEACRGQGEELPREEHQGRVLAVTAPGILCPTASRRPPVSYPPQPIHLSYFAARVPFSLRSLVEWVLVSEASPMKWLRIRCSCCEQLFAMDHHCRHLPRLEDCACATHRGARVLLEIVVRGRRRPANSLTENGCANGPTSAMDSR